MLYENLNNKQRFCISTSKCYCYSFFIFKISSKSICNLFYCNNKFVLNSFLNIRFYSKTTYFCFPSISELQSSLQQSRQILNDDVSLIPNDDPKITESNNHHEDPQNENLSVVNPSPKLRVSNMSSHPTIPDQDMIVRDSGSEQLSPRKQTFQYDDNTESFFLVQNSNNNKPIVSTELLLKSDLYNQPLDSQHYYQQRFELQCKLNEKYTSPLDDFGFLKSKESILFLKSVEKYNIYRIITTKIFYSKFISCIVKTVYHLKPLSFYYIQNLDIIIRKSTVRGSGSVIPTATVDYLPYNQFLPNVPFSVGAAVYGSSLAASDLLLYIPTPYYCMNFDLEMSDIRNSTVRIKYEKCNIPNPIDILRSGEKVEHIDYSASDLDGTEYLFVFNPVEFKNININFKINDNNTGYFNNYYFKAFDDLFMFEDSKSTINNMLNVSVKYSIMNTPIRTAATTRDLDGRFQSGTSGYMVQNVITSSVNFNLSDSYVLQLINVLLHLPNFKNLSTDAKNDIIRYVSSVFAVYILNQIIKVDQIILLSLNVSFKIVLKHHTNPLLLHQKYKKYVDDGNFYPLTPLHYKFYYNPNISDFVKYIIMSSLVIPGINQSINTIQPFVDKDSKHNFYNYANNHLYLDYNYYNFNTTLGFMLPEYKISWEQFMHEMTTKCMLFGSFNDIHPILSDGNWVGISGSSDKVSIPYMNRYFVKFNMISNLLINKLIDNFVWKDNDHPPFIKKSTRLVDKLPNIFERFIENEYESSSNSLDYNLSDYKSVIESQEKEED